MAGPDAPSPQIIVELRQLGGAITRPTAEPSAIDHRDAAYSLLTIGVGVPPMRDATVAHSATTFAALAPWSDGGALPNFVGSPTPERVARTYTPETLERLGALAAQYDPHGVMAGGVAVRAATGRATSDQT